MIRFNFRVNTPPQNLGLSIKNVFRFQHASSTSHIPLISPLLNHRLLGKSQFQSNVDEEAILELLRDISTVPVPPSIVKCTSFFDLPHASKLPFLPRNLTQNSIENYIDRLTKFRYPKKEYSKIAEILLQIVEEVPSLLSKQHYLQIISFYHHYLNDKAGFQVLNLMIANTEIKQDIDFDNILLSRNSRPSAYRQKIERLEMLKDKEEESNRNTWYAIFNMFNNPEPKISMLDLMKEYQVPIGPIISSLLPVIDYYSPEQLISLYRESGFTLDDPKLKPSLFNQLIACYLKDERLEEAWSLVINNPNSKKFVTLGLFVTFTTHFLKHNQLGFAYAFANYFKKNYKIEKVNDILVSMVLNVYLINCPVFDNWLTMVRINMAIVKKHNSFLNTKTLSNLHDYCELNHISSDFDSIDAVDVAITEMIEKDLIWSEKPVFQINENTPSFIQAAKALGQHDE